MSQIPYKNPISPIQEYGTPSIRNTELFGTHFSVYGVGGYMEVYNVSDLYYTIPSNTYGLIQYSGNTIPISFSKGSGTTFSLNTLNLNSDLISSGRRKLGMLVYVYETDQIYQFLIDNYDTLWSASTASTGTVVTNEFGTVVRADSSENISFINSWTGNTVEGISGATRSTSVWKKLQTGSGGGGSGGTLNYFVSGTTPTTTQSGDRWFNTNTGVELVWINDGDSSQWIQPFSVPGPLSPDAGYFTYTGLTTGQTLTWDKTYWGISGSSNVNLTLPTTTAKDGYYIIIKDEAGTCGSYRIRLTPASGLIDGNNYVDMNINYMSLTCMVRGGNWYLI